MNWEDMNPFQKLVRSRKFWLMILDVVISTVTFFVSRYINPEISEEIIWVIGAWQPVIVALILGIAHEDAAEKKAIVFDSEEDGGE